MAYYWRADLNILRAEGDHSPWAVVKSLASTTRMREGERARWGKDGQAQRFPRR